MRERGMMYLQEANRMIPKAWYERRSAWISTIATAVAIDAIGFINLLTGADKPAYHLIGAGLYLLSAIVDRTATSKLFHSMDEARDNRVTIAHVEMNPFLDNIPTGQEYDKSPRPLVLDAIGTGVSLVIPELIFPVTVLKMFGSLSQRRNAKRYEKATEIAQLYNQ